MIRPRGYAGRVGSLARRAGLALSPVAALFLWVSCNENLPTGPMTFPASLAIVVAHDTIVVGDSSSATAKVTDGSGNVIQGLSFAWTSADSTIVGFAAVAAPLPPAPATDASSGRARTLIARRTGRSLVALTLPDPRFVTSNVTRTETAVVAGVKVLTAHDTTLTAINDTAFAAATGLVHVNGVSVNRALTGVTWTHLGLHTSVVGTGDTIRYIARSNGADTLIATHPFCLAGAKCADTAIVRVSQQLTLTLSGHAFLSWSFNDSLGPSVTLADRRGVGLANSSVRFVPATAADSAIVKVSAPVGIPNPVTGLLAAPKLISSGNGAARVKVLGISDDGLTTVAVDSITDVVRQVARRISVEPLRAVITSNDSIPIRPLAHDARGAVIADALVAPNPSGIVLNGIWTVPMDIGGVSLVTVITPTLAGAALPEANPLAPQIPYAIDPATITLLQRDTVVAGLTTRNISVPLLDSLAQPAPLKWVRFGVSFGAVPDSVQSNAAGVMSTSWTPPDSAAAYTLTGLRGPLTTPLTVADSAGRIVIRHSVVVVADTASPLKSTVGISATSIPKNGTATVTVTMKDRFGNPVKNAKPTDFVLASGVGMGTFGAVTCDTGVCTVTYTAPAAAGPDVVSATILGANILGSPIALTITP